MAENEANLFILVAHLPPSPCFSDSAFFRKQKKGEGDNIDNDTRAG